MASWVSTEAMTTSGVPNKWGRQAFQGAIVFSSIAVPFLLMWGYLSYSRRHVPMSADFDGLALVASLTFGFAPLFYIPMKSTVRLGTLALYALAGGSVLVMFSLYYVCDNFNACM